LEQVCLEIVILSTKMAKKLVRYELNEGDIEATLNYLKTNKDPNSTREDAINFLQGAQATIHMASHAIEGVKSLKELQNRLKKKES
jgi:hypothetical protein